MSGALVAHMMMRKYNNNDGKPVDSYARKYNGRFESFRKFYLEGLQLKEKPIKRENFFTRLFGKNKYKII